MRWILKAFRAAGQNVAALLTAIALTIALILYTYTIPANAKTKVKSIVAIGDSLTAAYGIEPSAGWVHLLTLRLKQQGYDYQVVNAGISGETSSNGLQRFAATLDQHDPEIVIIGFGSNDGLRGLSLQKMAANLSKMITTAQQRDIKILLLGFKLPQNYGSAYRQEFEAVFAKLARQYNLTFVPFLLEHVALDQQFILPDNVHPNAAAQPMILDNVWIKLQILLSR